ncbi:unnamed protein product, partial [Ectocarpus fasciculatus]
EQAVCKAGGKKFVNGISSWYEDDYPRDLEGVLTEKEFKDVMNTLNDIIMSYWPCDVCYTFGYVAAPCTLGLSLCCPGKCAGMAEQKATQYVEQVSLKKKYYENNVTWRIRKTCFNSWVEISFPAKLKETGLPDF